VISQDIDDLRASELQPQNEMIALNELPFNLRNLPSDIPPQNHDFKTLQQNFMNETKGS